MMDSASDLVSLLRSVPADQVGFRSATVTAWNAETGQSTVIVGGTPVNDLPVLIATEKLAITVGDVVGVLTITGQMAILGRFVTDEGEIVVRSATGQIQFRIGRSSGGGGELVTYHPNGEPHTFLGQLFLQGTGEIIGQGFVVQQDNGGDVLGVFPLTPGGPQLIRMRDPFGNLMFTTKSVGGWSLFGEGDSLVAATDETHQQLLNRPFLDVPMWPVQFEQPEPWATSSSNYVNLWLGRLWVTHPAVHVQIRAVCDPGVTGAWGVEVNDIEIAPTQAIPDTGGASAFYDRGNQLLPEVIRNAPYSFTKIEIKARKTNAVAGRVHVFPYGVTKRGTP